MAVESEWWRRAAHPKLHHSAGRSRIEYARCPGMNAARGDAGLPQADDQRRHALIHVGNHAAMTDMNLRMAGALAVEVFIDWERADVCHRRHSQSSGQPARRIW
jgi:hypothetical protein